MIFKCYYDYDLFHDTRRNTNKDYWLLFFLVADKVMLLTLDDLHDIPINSIISNINNSILQS